MGQGITLPSARVVAQVVTEAELWDQSSESLRGSLLQSWRWGELKSRHGWSPVRLLLTALEDRINHKDTKARRRESEIDTDKS